MLKYNLILCLALLTALPLAAAPRQNSKIPANVPKEFAGQERNWLMKNALSPELVTQRVTAIAKEFLQNKDVQMPRLRMMIRELKSYEKYYFFEADTKFSRRWMKQNIAFAEALLKAKSKMNFLIMNKKTDGDEYRRWYDYYGKTAKQYWNISRKPLPAANVKRQLRLKELVQKRELAKEQAQDAKKPVLDEKKHKTK